MKMGFGDGIMKRKIERRLGDMRYPDDFKQKTSSDVREEGKMGLGDGITGRKAKQRLRDKGGRTR